MSEFCRRSTGEVVDLKALIKRETKRTLLVSESWSDIHVCKGCNHVGHLQYAKPPIRCTTPTERAAQDSMRHGTNHAAH